MKAGLDRLLYDAFGDLDATGLGVIDVGSRGRVHPVFDEVAPLVDAVGFEPDLEECRRLNESVGPTGSYRSLTFLPFGLGSEDGLRTLRLCRSRGTSSLLPPNRAFLDRFPEAERFDVEREISVPVRAFDGMVSDPTLRLPGRIDFVKVDTQGSELDVLRGVRKTLCDQMVAVEVEVEFAQLYESSVLFRDVDAYLAECGFTLFKLRRLEWVRQPFAARPERSAGQVVFGDALYLRDPLNRRIPWSPKDRHQAEALVLIAALYDLHDFAWEVASAPEMSGLLEAEKIKRYIAQRSGRLTPHWGRVQAFRDLLCGMRSAMKSVRRFRRYESAWARGDGNFYFRG